MPPVDPVFTSIIDQAFQEIKKTIPWKENLHKFPYALRPFPKNLWRWGLNLAYLQRFSRMENVELAAEKAAA